MRDNFKYHSANLVMENKWHSEFLFFNSSRSLYYTFKYFVPLNFDESYSWNVYKEIFENEVYVYYRFVHPALCVYFCFDTEYNFFKISIRSEFSLLLNHRSIGFLGQIRILDKSKTGLKTCEAFSYLILMSVIVLRIKLMFIAFQRSLVH